MSDLKTGWLSPNGTFTPCGVYEHISTAYKLLGVDYTSRPDEKLHDAGYAEITLSQLGVKEWRVYWKNFLTDEQKNFLKPYFEDEDRPAAYVSKMRWDKENDL